MSVVELKTNFHIVDNKVFVFVCDFQTVVNYTAGDTLIYSHWLLVYMPNYIKHVKRKGSCHSCERQNPLHSLLSNQFGLSFGCFLFVCLFLRGAIIFAPVVTQTNRGYKCLYSTLVKIKRLNCKRQSHDEQLSV